MPTDTLVRRAARAKKAVGCALVYFDLMADGALLNRTVTFPDEAAAEAEFLRTSFGLVLGGSLPEPEDPDPLLLRDSAIIWDARSKRPSQVFSFRKARPGESRMPIFLSLDVETAQVRELSVEQYAMEK